MYIFVWKNCLLAKNTLKSAWGELFIYAFLISFMARDNCEKKTAQTADTTNIVIICYTPKNDKFINNLMEGVQTDFGMSFNEVYSFNTEQDMFKFMNNQKADEIFAVTFSKYSGPKGITGTNLIYTINIGHQLNIPRTFFFDKKYDGPDFDSYVNSGVLNLKQVIDARFRKLTEATGSNMPQVRAEAISTTREKLCFTTHNEITSFGLIFLILMKRILIRFVLAKLVQEKDNGTKDFLALSLLDAALYDLAFFLIMFLITFLYTSLVILCTTTFHPLGETSLLHIYVLCGAYLLSDMAYTFMISTFFDSVFKGQVGGIIFHYVPLVLNFANESIRYKYSFLNGSNLFYHTIEFFHKFSENARNFGPEVEEVSSLPIVYSSLVFQSILFMCLYFYLNAVIPGKGRKRQPFYFIIHPSFYFGRKEQHIECSDEDSSIKHGIEVINLTKTCRDGSRNQLALDDINISIESNCTTTLIGPNDSGKTTLINIILGYDSQTSGDIIVEGNKNPNNLRKLIGFCPERSILFPYLTCMEHLTFFGCLKGFDSKTAKKNATTLLTKVKIPNKMPLSVENLTAAIKRKLSLAIALSGCTKILILDQPTSGLDIISRREIWDILLELRNLKTILIATNDMEEAEILSDNVIVMSKGTILQSSSALKFKYQHEYDYILKLDIENNFNIHPTMNLIHDFIPEAKVHGSYDTSICIRMPYSCKSVYTDVLTKLEEMTNDLKISKITFTNNFFEDAFIHLMKEPGDEPDKIMCHAFLQNNNNSNAVGEVSTDYEDITTIPTSREIMAIFYKKLLFIKRDLFFSLSLFLIPIISIAVAFATIHSHELNERRLFCDMNGSDIFITFSKKFQNFQDIIIDDIRKKNGTPILVPQDRVVESITKIHNYDIYTNINEIVLVIVQFDDDENTIRVVQLGNPQTCRSEEMTKMINEAILRTKERESKQIHHVELADGSVERAATPKMLNYYSSIVPIGWCIYIVFYVSLPYMEDSTGFKQLRNISPFKYWSAFILADICLHTIICVLTFVGQKILDTIYSDPEQATLMLSFIFYGFGYIPILYILVGLLKDISTMLSYLILSAILQIVTDILWNVFPDTGLQHQLILINKNYYVRPRNETFIDMHLQNIMEENKSLIRFYGTMAALLSSLSIILIFWLEKNLLLGASGIQTLQMIVSTDNVLAEKERVENIIREKKQKEYALIVNKLVKLQKTSGKNNADPPSHSFAVCPGECFGIIGLNDSGKTKTMQQIIGNLRINSGEFSIYSVDRDKNLKTFKQLIGYGMQDNALNNFMTPEEILKYTALLRGFTNNEIPRIIKDWMEKLDFVKHKNTLIKECSYATKRKLCMSIAMIGKQVVIFLDDPTNGIDPICRKLMWKCIRQVQKENKAVILSTNNLDECEYLCNRISVLHLGYMKNFGNIRQLKMNLQHGCVLTIKLRNEHLRAEINVLIAKLSQTFAGYITYVPPVIRYFVSERPLFWSLIFARMQALSEDHKNVIGDFYVKEITIEALLINPPPVPTVAAV